MTLQGLNLFDLFTSAKGRIGRARFWFGVAIILAVSLTLYLLSVWLAGPYSAAARLNMLLSVLLFYPAYALMAKRFQDRNKPGSIAFVGLLIVYTINAAHVAGLLRDDQPGMLLTVTDLLLVGINLWFLVELGLLKGTQGPNAYGPDPLGATVSDASL
jgi:uncharacterized membrane protein YhaH (DUF805 family)